MKVRPRLSSTVDVDCAPGIFAWLAVNFLLGRVGQDPELTVGTIDLGGGSTQACRAV